MAHNAFNGEVAPSGSPGNVHLLHDIFVHKCLVNTTRTLILFLITNCNDRTEIGVMSCCACWLSTLGRHESVTFIFQVPALFSAENAGLSPFPLPS